LDWILNIIINFFSQLIIISMSGDSETAPTYYFNGITFNPSFYQSTSGNYLTLATAKNIFLTYPTAQGTETIDWLRTSQISSLRPAENFNFLDAQTANLYIGNTATGTTNQLIQVGASALTTVQCGALTIKERSINNATSATTGNIYIGDNQTSGAIHIGTGNNVLRTAGSSINIGNYSTSAGTINVGTSATTTNINGKGSIYATKFDIHDPTAVLQLGDLQTTGRLDIGSGGSRSGTGAINIGTGGSALFQITIGSTTSTTTMQGTSVSVSTKLLTPQIDTASDITDLSLGSNIAGGQIKIGGGIVNGSLFICHGNQFGGAINIGAASTTAANIINLGNNNTTVKIPNKLVTPAIDTGTTGTALSLGSNILTANIEIGGNQTTGDINIGTNATSDIYLGNATNATAGTNVGVCHINKAQAGTNGSVFREIRFGTIAGGSGNGTVGFTPNMVSNPIVFAQINSSSSTQTFSVGISSVSTTGFSYNKNWIYNNATAGGNPLGESIYWIAISP
jgi:hypothetical protein